MARKLERKTMEELERRIKKEVEPHVGKPVALSGGIDSSLLAVLARPRFVISVKLPGDEKYDEIEWSSRVAAQLGLEHVIVEPDQEKFDEYTTEAVRAIGRPIPHFNVFPLWCMYQKLAEMGEKELILGDGPDETMCGYGRDLILHYLYNLYNVEALEHYKPLLDKVLPPKTKAIEALTGLKGFEDIVEVDIAMRKDMDDMSDGIAKHFGIKNIRPYQDNPEMDDYMRDLPISQKIQGEYGKWLLRQILAQYLPFIADRKKKVGGPVYPVNIIKKWMKDGEFDKKQWLKYQEEILATK